LVFFIPLQQITFLFFGTDIDQRDNYRKAAEQRLRTTRNERMGGFRSAPDRTDWSIWLAI
jgi:hypothetical protein